MLATGRLKLVPATVDHVRAEIGNRAEFARLIQAGVPENWPPASAADALPLFLRWLEAAPHQVGWFGWYAIAEESGANLPTLIGCGGFLGPPQNGEVTIGYSVLPQFQRRGFATEMAGALVEWALDQPHVKRIVAETEWENPESVRVLSKLGFAESATSRAGGGTRFELSADARAT